MIDNSTAKNLRVVVTMAKVSEPKLEITLKMKSWPTALTGPHLTKQQLKMSTIT
jgi:hypothetical protein